MQPNNTIIIVIIASDSGDILDTTNSESGLHEQAQCTRGSTTLITIMKMRPKPKPKLNHTKSYHWATNVLIILYRCLKSSCSISPITGAVETAVHVEVEETCTYTATIGQSNCNMTKRLFIILLNSIR